jgi:endoglucanase
MMQLPKKFSRYPQAALMVLVVVGFGLVIFLARASSLVGDLNNDGVVNIFDLSIMLSDWGTNNATADLNHDGTVNIFDLSILLSHWGETVSTPTPTPTPSTAGYTVVGNSIENASGQKVLLHGVDRPSLEWSCTGQAVTGGASGIPASDFTTMRNGWNANAVRIALNQDEWLPGATQYCSDYQSTVEAAVSAARAAGLIVILDLHWSDPGTLAYAHPTNGQQCMPDQYSVTFWQQVAAIYKSDPGVWFELYNEPYPPNANWSTWENGGSVTCAANFSGAPEETFTAAGMQSLVNAVRGAGANNIVIAGGVSYSSSLNGVPMLTGANVAYAVHPYINTSAPDGSTNGAWAAQFGNTAANVPVVATEFGDQTCGNSTYDNAILSYFHAHNVGYTAWAWYVGGCSFPSLITDAAGDCVVTMGCTTQADMKQQP